MNQPHPIMILIRGLPGSGKSYIAVELQKTIGINRVVMLDPDTIDFESQAYIAHTRALTQEGVDDSLHAYRFLRGQAYKGIADHKIIIWNQPFTNLEIFNKMVANFNIQAVENHTHLKILVIEVESDQSLAKERVTQRKQAGGHGPSDETFNRFKNDYQTFATEGYNTVLVHGNSDVNTSVDAVMNALKNLD